jgi:hypothetical protein
MKSLDRFAGRFGDGDIGDGGGGAFQAAADGTSRTDSWSQGEPQQDEPDCSYATWSAKETVLLCIDPTDLSARAINIPVRAKQP